MQRYRDRCHIDAPNWDKIFPPKFTDKRNHALIKVYNSMEKKGRNEK